MTKSIDESFMGRRMGRMSDVIGKGAKVMKVTFELEADVVETIMGELRQRSPVSPAAHEAYLKLESGLEGSGFDEVLKERELISQSLSKIVNTLFKYKDIVDNDIPDA